MTDATVAMTRCNYCGEEIIASAKKCKHCGEILDPTMREIETLKNSKQSQVFMNAGGGGGGAAAAASSGGSDKLRPFNHLLHLILTIFTAGLWGIVWLLLYIFRNKNIYY